MKFKYLIILFTLFSCTTTSTKFDNRSPYNSKGFFFIYNDKDVNDKIIKGKLNNEQLQVSHRKLRNNTLIKISNPKLTIFNIKKYEFSNYPDFYKILITKSCS